MSSTGCFLTVLLLLSVSFVLALTVFFVFDGAVAPRPFLVLRRLAEVSMMAKEWKDRLESLEYSVESLIDDKEMRSGSSIETSIFAG